jgi:hypothetical protein
MKKLFIIFTIALSVFFVQSCADFWAPGIRVYKVETQEHPFTYTNLIGITISVGEIYVHNHNTNTVQIVLSNYVDAGGWTVGSNFIENNILFTVNTNDQTNLNISQTEGIQPDYWEIYGLGSKVHVYLPQGVDISQIRLATQTGDITLEVNNQFSVANAISGTGEITSLGILSSTNVDFQTDTGRIEIQDIKADSVNLHSDTGKIKVFGQIECPYITSQVNTGKLDLTLTKAQYVYFLSDTGSVDLKINSFISNQTDGWVIIRTDTGSIDLGIQNDFADFLSITASADTGSVHHDIDMLNVIEQRYNYLRATKGVSSMDFTLETDTGSIDIYDFQ